MWGGRGEGSAGGFVFLWEGKCSCPADRCHMHRVLRFLLFIVDGEFAISAGHTGHTRHELAPGPRELPPSLHNPFASLPPEPPPSPVYLLCIDLVSQGFVPGPPHTVPVPLGSTFRSPPHLSPSLLLWVAAVCLLDSALTLLTVPGSHRSVSWQFFWPRG